QSCSVKLSKGWSGCASHTHPEPPQLGYSTLGSTTAPPRPQTLGDNLIEAGCPPLPGVVSDRLSPRCVAKTDPRTSTPVGPTRPPLRDRIRQLLFPCRRITPTSVDDVLRVLHHPPEALTQADQFQVGELPVVP